jgi:hypothetical protein
MAIYGLNLTGAGAGNDTHGMVVDVDAETLGEAITEAELAHPGFRVVRGQRKDLAEATITHTDLESFFSRKKRGAVSA